MYNSLILPHLQYGILLWGFKHNRVFKLQKKAIRTISRSKYNAHTSPIFKNLELLKIEDILNISLLKFQFKLVNEKLPHYFPSIFYQIQTNHNYNTRNHDVVQLPIPNTNSSFYSLRYFLPNFVENIPRLITDKMTTHSYKGFSNYTKKHFLKENSSECHILNCYICDGQ